MSAFENRGEQRYFVFDSWLKSMYDDPKDAHENMPWDLLDSAEWKNLLTHRPELGKYCRWEKMTQEDIKSLISIRRTDLMPFLDWDNLDKYVKYLLWTDGQGTPLNDALGDNPNVEVLKQIIAKWNEIKSTGRARGKEDKAAKIESLLEALCTKHGLPKPVFAPAPVVEREQPTVAKQRIREEKSSNALTIDTKEAIARLMSNPSDVVFYEYHILKNINADGWYKLISRHPELILHMPNSIGNRDESDSAKNRFIHWKFADQAYNYIMEDRAINNFVAWWPFFSDDQRRNVEIKTKSGVNMMTFYRDVDMLTAPLMKLPSIKATYKPDKNIPKDWIDGAAPAPVEKAEEITRASEPGAALSPDDYNLFNRLGDRLQGATFEFEEYSFYGDDRGRRTAKITRVTYWEKGDRARLYFKLEKGMPEFYMNLAGASRDVQHSFDKDFNRSYYDMPDELKSYSICHIPYKEATFTRQQLNSIVSALQGAIIKKYNELGGAKLPAPAAPAPVETAKEETVAIKRHYISDEALERVAIKITENPVWVKSKRGKDKDYVISEANVKDWDGRVIDLDVINGGARFVLYIDNTKDTGDGLSHVLKYAKFRLTASPITTRDIKSLGALLWALAENLDTLLRKEIMDENLKPSNVYAISPVEEAKTEAPSSEPMPESDAPYPYNRLNVWEAIAEDIKGKAISYPTLVGHDEELGVIVKSELVKDEGYSGVLSLAYLYIVAGYKDRSKGEIEIHIPIMGEVKPKNVFTVLEFSAQANANDTPAWFKYDKLIGVSRTMSEITRSVFLSAVKLTIINSYKKLYGKKDKPDTCPACSASPVEDLKLIEKNVGHKTTISTPTESIPAIYAIVEVNSLIPSNDPITFSANPRYPVSCQTRSYSQDKGEQEKVRLYASHFDPAHVVNDSPDATTGAPIVLPNGVVLGGNGRTMVLQRLAITSEIVYQNEYVKYLKSKISHYTSNPADLDDYKNPCLVRVVNVDMNQCSKYSNILNQSNAQQMDATREGIAIAAQMTEGLIDLIGEAMLASEIGTFLDAIKKPSVAKTMIKALETSGAIHHVNKSRYIDGNYLTEAGIELVENVLLGMILPDKRVIEQSKTFTNKIIMALPSLLRIKKHSGDWNIIPDLVEAIKLSAAAKSLNLKIDDYINQQAMFGDPPTHRQYCIWKLLDSLGPKVFKNFAKSFADAADANTGASMFDNQISADEVLAKALMFHNIKDKNLNGLNDLAANVDDYTEAMRFTIEQFAQTLFAPRKIHISFTPTWFEVWDDGANTRIGRFATADFRQYNGDDMFGETKREDGDEDRLIALAKYIKGLSPSSRKLLDRKQMSLFDNVKNLGDIIDIKPNPVQLTGKTAALLGKLNKPFKILLWGYRGQGKSTLSLIMACDFAKDGIVLYFCTEEKIATGRISERIKLNGLPNDANIIFSDDGTMQGLVDAMNAEKPAYVVVDSINRLDDKGVNLIALANEFPETCFVWVAQSDKLGKIYVGPRELGFENDTEIMVAEAKAKTLKHRDGIAFKEVDVFANEGEAAKPRYRFRKIESAWA